VVTAPVEDAGCADVAVFTAPVEDAGCVEVPVFTAPLDDDGGVDVADLAAPADVAADEGADVTLSTAFPIEAEGAVTFSMAAGSLT